MPTFTFTSPEGKSYDVNGPDGSTKEQAFAILQQQMGAKQNAAPTRHAEGDRDSAVQEQWDRISGLSSDLIKNGQQSKAKSALASAASPLEAAANFVTGVGSSVVGGIAGIGSMAKSGIQNQIEHGIHMPTREEFDAAAAKAADTSQSVQQAGTYQPRTTAGKLITELASSPLVLASRAFRGVGGDIGQVVNGDQGRMAGEAIAGVIPEAYTVIAGGRSALKSARGTPAPQPTPVVDEAPVNMIRNSNTEAPQNAVTNRYDAAGNRIVPPEPIAPTGGSAEGGPNLHRIQRQTEGGGLPIEEQTMRAQVLQRIGLEDARRSAVAGDAMEGATQAQIAKFTQEPAGQAAAERFNTERNALQSHAESIISDTGGSRGMDVSTRNSRGQVIAAPFDELRQYFDAETNMLYKMADDASGGLPTTKLSGLKKFIDTKSNFSGKAENSSLGNGVAHYLTEQGIMDAAGNISKVTPMQAEGIKQYINGQWSPGTSGLAGKIKSIIDGDVFKGAGEDIYAQARNMFKMKKATLDNPTGMAKITEFDTQTPINRTTPFEKIPDTLTNLPVAQFGHVVDVLNKILDPEFNTPELLQLKAHDALNEIKSHMANELHETGSKFQTKWNAPGVTQYLKNNAPKFQMVFDDASLRKISDLNDAGHILSVDKSYPGSAAQGAIAVKRGLLPNVVGKAAAGVGGLTGSFAAGPVGATAGAAIGSAAGDSLAASMGGKSALNKFNQGIVNLSDFLNPITEKPINAPPDVGGLVDAAGGFAPAAYGAQNQRLAAEVAKLKAMRRTQSMQNLGNAKSVDEAIKAAMDANN